MLNAVEVFSKSNENGLFINSCFAHCQSERQDTWYADASPRIGDKVCHFYHYFKQQCHKTYNRVFMNLFAVFLKWAFIYFILPKNLYKIVELP